ncbi:MAG: type I-E CRISPR-associated protein Cas5/CasD [Armatimonadetes bacterium]|nr:type I-E CRISPR-associated protein Cas5/CasD [Armatimonadota bacterium]
MPVLLLRLAGPMQSWGTQSRFTDRDTGREPSKSGVVGLLAAALGVPRTDEGTIARLAALRMGVRVDREGQVRTDFHTAGGGRVPGLKRYGVAKADGSSLKDNTVVSYRHYLCDAEFLVGMEGNDRAWLDQLDAALANPVWPLYLGRKSFPPSLPVRVGVSDLSLLDALRSVPWRSRHDDDKPDPQRGLRVVIETTDPTFEARYDQPVSFHILDRSYRLRYVRTEWFRADEVPIEPVPKKVKPCTSPD